MARKALCIGIDDYQDPEPDLHLRGGVNDAVAWAELLATHYDYEAISLLANRAATKRAILAGIDELVKGSKRGDVLVFAFSGHGSFVVSGRGGDERYDEAICAYDGLIVDDELGRRFRGLPRGVRLTAVSDSCFAAGVLDIESIDPEPGDAEGGRGKRPKGKRPKGKRPKGKRPKLLDPKHVGHPFDGDYERARPRRRIDEAGMHELLVAACGPGDVAWDDDFDGVAHGVMTYYAIEAIKAARYDLTAAQLVAAVDQRIPKPAFDQAPLLEGPSSMKGRTIFS